MIDRLCSYVLEEVSSFLCVQEIHTLYRALSCASCPIQPINEQEILRSVFYIEYTYPYHCIGCNRIFHGYSELQRHHSRYNHMFPLHHLFVSFPFIHMHTPHHDTFSDVNYLLTSLQDVPCYYDQCTCNPRLKSKTSSSTHIQTSYGLFALTDIYKHPSQCKLIHFYSHDWLIYFMEHSYNPIALPVLYIKN